MRRRFFSSIGVGGSSILVIFVLLCLTTFATLSLATANADRNLTRRTAQSVSDYYAADAEAERYLAVVDSALLNSKRTAASRTEYYQAVIDELVNLEGVALYMANDGTNLLISYTIPAGESAALSVQLRTEADLPERYRIEQWKLVPTGDWQPEPGGFELWDGG